MTTTNNNREYAIRLYYEVREADNSINCKTAYEVFDNMQDAANYAIDFIANNPDANIRLTNEHFNGSQISVYGDSPTKHYDLTDADINAVRNVEVNEADVEDYAVTEEAQNVATNSEIRNANIASGNYDDYIYCGNDHGFKLFEFVTFKNHSIVYIDSPRYGLTLNTTFRGNRVFKHNGRRIAAKAVAEIYMNSERADEQDKIFRAYFANIPDKRGCFEVWVHLTYADGREHKYMFEFNQTKQVEQFKQEVQSFAAANNTPCQIFVRTQHYKSKVTAWVDPHQYGEPGNLEQPRDISVYCNDDTPNIKHRFLVDIYFENTDTCNCITKSSFHANSCDAANFIINFAAKHPNRKILDVKIRDWENIYTSYQLSEADFYALYPFVEDDFAREYAQAATATDRIRKIDPDAEIIFAADEPVAERFILTTGDNSCANCATAAEAEDLFYQLQDDKPAPTVKPAARSELPYSITFPNGEDLWSLDGKWNHIASDKYGADIYRNGLTGEPEFVIRYSDDDKRWATAEEFFAEMVKRGACTIDEPPIDEPPADDFKAQLSALKAKAADAHNAEQAAQRLLDEAEAAYKKAEDSHRDAYLDAHNADVAIKKFLADKAKELRDNLLDDDIFNGKIAIIAQGGKRFDEPELGQIWIDVTPDQKFLINSCTKFFATYDTPAQVTAAVELLRDAIKRGDSEFAFPTVAELEATDAVNKLNAAAPEGWSVVPDPDNKKFFVKTGGKSVAEIDSLALAKVLPPDKFFARFTPLTDDEPNQRYADQLYQEYLELLDMRDNLSDDPERLKVIDGLIRDLEREMLAARLDLPTSTPTTAC